MSSWFNEQITELLLHLTDCVLLLIPSARLRLPRPTLPDPSRLLEDLAICMEVLEETLRHPSGIHGPHAPDGCIQNYDCPYHIILTNVKTNSRVHREEGKDPAISSTSGQDSGLRRHVWRGSGPEAGPVPAQAAGLHQRGTSTIRPETWPCRSCSKTSLMCVSGRVAVWQRIFPAAAMDST